MVDVRGKAVIEAGGHIWAARYATQIIKEEDGVTGNTTLYTVPNGKVVFITGAWVSGSSASTSARLTGAVNVDNAGANSDIVNITITVMQTSAGSPGTNSLSMAYPMPIKVVADKVIVLIATAGSVSGGFIGWEEDA